LYVSLSFLPVKNPNIKHAEIVPATVSVKTPMLPPKVGVPSVMFKPTFLTAALPSYTPKPAMNIVSATQSISNGHCSNWCAIIELSSRSSVESSSHDSHARNCAGRICIPNSRCWMIVKKIARRAWTRDPVKRALAAQCVVSSLGSDSEPRAACASRAAYIIIKTILRETCVNQTHYNGY
jgi:hypothetical protein